MKFGDLKISGALLVLVTVSVAGCGSVDRLDLRKKHSGSSGDSTALTGEKPANSGASQSEPNQGTRGPSTAVSNDSKDNSRFPAGNICRLPRKKLEDAGILSYTGKIVPIGEFSLANGPATDGDSAVEPPNAETEVIDGVEYQIYYTVEASCNSRVKNTVFAFLGEQNSLALQESLFNAMCQKGPQPLSDSPVSNQAPDSPASNQTKATKSPRPVYSSKQFWRAFETRKCVESKLKHYVDSNGNEVVFGQIGPLEHAVN